MMVSTKTKVMTIDTIDRQRRYVDAQKEKGQGLGVVFADAFLRGMRDLGYKSPAWALAEQIDNSFQAGADTVAIRFGYKKGNSTRNKPDHVAICDNGNGMIPDMIGFAVRWGGTDREGDRTGFGRYGYGLPSSAVSMAKRYTVYSKPSGGEWHAVTVDIDDLAAVAGDLERTTKLLSAKPSALPSWLAGAGHDDDLDVASMPSGTVVVLEDLDRLRSLAGWIKAETLKTKLLQHFGVIYRHWLPEHRIVVDGMAAQVVDPLFLMEHGRFFDETSVRAQRVEARTIDVETSRGTTGSVRIRASVLPPNFQAADPADYDPDDARGSKVNKRHPIMRQWNGLQVCRQRRQIDCISPEWTKFQTYDANIKIEIDFDPELDEYFGLTTAKQQIVIEDEMWERLRHGGKNGGGLEQLVRDMRRRFKEMKEALAAEAENKAGQDGPRPSAVAMAESEKFKGAVPEPTSAQEDDARRNLADRARERAEASGKPVEEVEEELKEEARRNRWVVEFAPIPEGPFYRPIRLGEQKLVQINTEHPFYTKIYNATPDVRAALEVVLFVLAERELEVRDDAERFYRAERQRWSERLRDALDVLVTDQQMTDKAAAMAEWMHSGAEGSAG